MDYSIPGYFGTLRTWAEIDLNAIRKNFDTVKNHLPASMKLAAVVKADAYGHGAVRVAKFLDDSVDCFAVAMTDEAVELRHAGIRSPILILGHIPPTDYRAVVKFDIMPTICCRSEAELLITAAREFGKIPKYHVAVDTGMSRIGFPANEESVNTIAELSRLDSIRLEGVFSHFAMSDSADKSYANQQMEVFDRILASLKEKGVRPSVCHMYNSAALVDCEPKYGMAREGIILYGLEPSEEVDRERISSLVPAMSLRSHIVQVKTVPAGVPISYGCTYVTEKESVIATISIGYADGYPRILSNRGEVLIRGKRVPIVGRICMDQLMADVSGIGAAIGDIVTLFGRDGEEVITADEVASRAETIGYEVVCGISKRVPRVYLKNGKIDSIRRILPIE